MDRIQVLENKMNGKFENLMKFWRTQEEGLKECFDRREMLWNVMSAMGRDPSSPAVLTVPITGQSQEASRTLSTLAEEFRRASVPTSLGAQNSLNSHVQNNNEIEDKGGELSIPVEHTTAAHKLLLWPSIRQLLNASYDPDYAMLLEEQRGLIIVDDEYDNSLTADDTSIPMPPPVLVDGCQRKSHQSVDRASYTFDTTPFRKPDAEIDRSGLLRLDAETAWRYFRSYLDHMHKLHPFLWQQELEIKVHTFISCFCERSSPSSFGRDSRCQGKKRKRDDEVDIRHLSVEPGSESPQHLVGQHIENAIILFVFALGAISEHQAPLPDPKADGYRDQYIPLLTESVAAEPCLEPDSSISHSSSGVLDPRRTQFDMSPNFSNPCAQYDQTCNSSSNLNQNLTGRKILAPRNDHGDVRNLAVIPGLALYGYASMILGSLRGGVGLQHVHAGLLASLYAGQLAHPFQSHSWICEAARACQVLIRPRQYDRLPDGQLMDQIKFAYWTCLQLESDLLAELDLPASGISRSESRINRPSGRFTIDLPNDMEARGTRMMLHYLSQIHLRTFLNRVHTDLYKVDEQDDAGCWSSTIQETLSTNLELWRSSLPDGMKWKDTEPPAADINTARLRAKYYGARYIIHRPVLYHILHNDQRSARVNSVPESFVFDTPTGSDPNVQTQQMSPSRTPASGSASTAHMQVDISNVNSAADSFPASSVTDWISPTIEFRKLPTKIRRACMVCIESAILSTEVFDGVKDGDLVVTNIFGTAHA